MEMYRMVRVVGKKFARLETRFSRTTSLYRVECMYQVAFVAKRLLIFSRFFNKLHQKFIFLSLIYSGSIIIPDVPLSQDSICVTRYIFSKLLINPPVLQFYLKIQLKN